MLLVVGFAFMVGGVLFPLLTPALGYGTETAWVCLVVVGAAGYLGLRGERLSVADIGGSPRQCLRATITMLVAYGLFCLLLIALRRSSPVLLLGGLPGLSLYGWFDNWIITGYSEELLFRGYLLSSLRRRLKSSHATLTAALLSSLAFSLYHLPFSLWFGRTGVTLAVDLAIPLVSSLAVFAPAYILSGNLWLSAFLHGVTNYPLLPVIKDEPLWGMVFMVVAITVGWALRLRGTRANVLRETRYVARSAAGPNPRAI